MMGLVPKLLLESTNEGAVDVFMVGADDWNEDGMGGHPSTFKRRVACCFTVVP